jgi:tRNA-dihydrouridine synthase
MSRVKHSITGAIARTLVVAAVIAGLPSFAPPATAAENIEEMLGSAKTAADHEAIAAHYEKEAAAAKEKAELHKRMLAIIKKQGGPAIAKWHMDRHCERLIKQFEDSAQMYTEMAQAHREIAKDLK